MARVTRSAALHTEKDKQPDPSTSARAKSSTKKRKRTSLTGSDDQPAPKQPRSEGTIKEESQQDDDDKLTKGKLSDLELAGDVPIDSSDAQMILDILELVDSQGLLDRVFPLPSSDLSEPSTSRSESGSFSLRALLREPSQHPLRVIRAAVQNLFPISHHPRSRASSPAVQQLRFCDLACSLLSQASFHSVPLPTDIETILSDFPEAAADSETKSSRSEKTAQLHQTKKYALVQRLPSGTWWTSLNSDLLPANTKQLKDLPTANAELVAIFPSPAEPLQTEAGSSEIPSVTLASYVPKKPPGYKLKLPGARRVSCGAFLNYGPYASFAPVFEQDGVELGRSTMGELFWRWEDRKKRWNEAQSLVVEQSSDEVVGSPRPNGADVSEEKVVFDGPESLEGLFPKEQVALLKQALGSLELEAAVQELLERNARALKRLAELQIKRLSRPGEFTPVEEGSEEWDTAHGILDSLSILASLRPRVSSTDTPPLTPSASTLHRLQQTLPIAPTRGWHGTLTADHPTALRDDSTLYIKSTATAIPVAAPAAPAPTPTPAQPAPAPTTPASTAAAAQAYAGYAYNYAAPYRTAYQYKPGQGTPYYPNAYATQTSAQGQATPQFYPTQQYNTTGQQQYAYSSWYQYNPQTQASTAGGSRKGTPQPSTAAAAATPAPAAPSTAIPTSYAGFFSANAQTSGQRVVANTVLAATSGGKPPYQPAAAGTWTAPGAAAATGYTAPTLPPHMRSAVVGQAGAAGSYNGSMYQPNYYGAYQATPSPAQS